MALAFQNDPALESFDNDDQSTTTASSSTLSDTNGISVMRTRLVADPLADDAASISTSTLFDEEAATAVPTPSHARKPSELVTADVDLDHETFEEFGLSENMRFYDEKVTSRQCKRELFARMRPRQFFVGSIMYRERKPRKVSWDELFMDLIFIAAISRVNEILRNSTTDFTAALLNQFALVFMIVYSTWAMLNTTSNRFAIEGFGCRLQYWLQMILVSGLGINARYAWNDDPNLSTATIFIVTFIIIRLVNQSANLVVMFWTPKFRENLSGAVVIALLGTIPFLVGIFCNSTVRIYLWWGGFVFDQTSFMILIFYSRFRNKMKYRVAVNIEHLNERYSLLHMVVLGEMAVSLLWANRDSDVKLPYVATLLGLIIAISFQWTYFNSDALKHGTHAIRRSARTALTWSLTHFPLHLFMVATGAALSQLIAVINAQQDGVYVFHRREEHDLVKDFANSTTAGNSTANSASSTHGNPVLSFSPGSAAPARGLFRLWFCGLAVTTLCMTTIGVMHKIENDSGLVYVRRRWRLTVRAVVGTFFAALGIWGGGDGRVDAMGCILIPSLLLLCVMLFEEIGRKLTLKGKAEEEEHHKHRHHSKHHDHESEQHHTHEGDKDHHDQTEGQGDSDLTVAADASSPSLGSDVPGSSPVGSLPDTGLRQRSSLQVNSRPTNNEDEITAEPVEPNRGSHDGRKHDRHGRLASSLHMHRVGTGSSSLFDASHRLMHFWHKHHGDGGGCHL